MHNFGKKGLEKKENESKSQSNGHVPKRKNYPQSRNAMNPL